MIPFFSINISKDIQVNYTLYRDNSISNNTWLTGWNTGPREQLANLCHLYYNIL